MARFCASCGAQVADAAAFCPACGKAVGQPAGGGFAAAPAPAPVSAPAQAAGGLEDNVAGLLAYITFIPAIIFLVMEPYNKRPFVRFHSFQSIFFGVACIAVAVVVGIIGSIPVLGWSTLLLWPLVCLGELAIWVVLLTKAYGGQRWKLPVIGDIAEKQTNAM